MYWDFSRTKKKIRGKTFHRRITKLPWRYYRNMAWNGRRDRRIRMIYRSVRSQYDDFRDFIDTMTAM